MRFALRAGGWSAVTVLVVLCARALAYALSPSPFALHFSRQVGGPVLPVVALVSVALALAVSSGIIWVAALGVRERSLLERRPVVVQPIRLWLLVVRAVVLFAVTCFVFAMLESYIHWRAGLGWHGLHCLTAPEHRDAIPLLGALSLLAAAAASALEHILGWMRRTIARLTALRFPAAATPPVRRISPTRPLSCRPFAHSLGARAPPLALS